jgi:hypothetical protein
MPLSSDPERRAAQLANLRRGPSTDPAERADQLSGLRPRETHGAYTAARRQPLEDEHRARLALEFPTALTAPGGNDLLNTAAKRAAMVDLLSAWLTDWGPISSTKRHEVSSATKTLARLLDSHERAIRELAALEREHGRGGAPSLDAYLAGRELPAGATTSEAA